MKLLLVTNDFPPRVGGIQSYLVNIYRRLAETDEVSVLAPAFSGDSSWDAAQPFRVVRHPRPIYWPTRSLTDVVRRESAGMDLVIFGAVLPMNAIGPRLDVPYAMHTHGFEVAWARVPPLRWELRRVGRRARLVTVVSDYTRRYIEGALGANVRIEMLKTGVDLERFNTSVSGDEVRERHGLQGRPVVVCVSRLVSRKGQDLIIRSMSAVRREVPGATALLVGGGPYRGALERLAARQGVGESVVFAGEVPEGELPSYYAAGDAFAMPCRSRWAGLEVEGLGLVYLEALACGRPAITGDSGGAPEAILDRKTGFVVPGRDEGALARALVALLGDAEGARQMGTAGRTFVEQNHDWAGVVARFRAMLSSVV